MGAGVELVTVLVGGADSVAADEAGTAAAGGAAPVVGVEAVDPPGLLTASARLVASDAAVGSEALT